MGKPMSTADVASDLIRALTTLSDVTVGGSSVDQEYLKPYWKSEKRRHLS